MAKETYNADYELIQLKNIMKYQIGIFDKQQLEKLLHLQSQNSVKLEEDEGGDTLIEKVCNVYDNIIEKQEGWLIKGVYGNPVYYSYEMIEPYIKDGKKLTFNKIRILRHMIVTIFILSDYKITPEMCKAEEENLPLDIIEEQMMQRLQEITQNELQDVKSVIRRNGLTIKESIDSLSSAVCGIKEKIDSTNGIELQMLEQLEKLNINIQKQNEHKHKTHSKSHIHSNKNQNNKEPEKETVKFIRNENQGYVLVKDKNGTKKKIPKNDPGYIINNLMPALHLQDELYSSDSQWSNEFDAAGDSMSGSEVETTVNKKPFIQHLDTVMGSNGTDRLRRACVQYLYNGLLINREAYKQSYKTFFKTYDSGEADAFQTDKELMQSVFGNFDIIDFDHDLYAIVGKEIELKWLSFLRLALYEKYIFFNFLQNELNIEKRCFEEVLQHFVYDYCLAATLIQKI
tara:strand:+ start:4881 stop:6251 length:1371 start_codon:yes stop_codon:yes gene_type:complete